MSGTDQHTSETSPAGKTPSWSDMVAESGNPEEIKSKLDIRTYGDKAMELVPVAVDWGKTYVKGLSEIPELYEDNPELAKKEALQGAAVGAVGTATLIADAVTWVAYDNLLAPVYNYVVGSALNSATNLLGGDTNWNLPLRQNGFSTFSEAVEGSITIAGPIEQKIEVMVNGEKTLIDNPHADAQQALRTTSMLVVDAAAVPVTAALGGGVLNVVKYGKILEGGTAAVKSFDRVKKVVRFDDAAELVKDANSGIKKVKKIADDMAEAAMKKGGKQSDDVIDKAQKLSKTADDVKSGKVHYTKTGDGSITDKLLTTIQKKYDEADGILSGEQTRTFLESASGKAASIIKGEPVSEVRGAINTRPDLANYLTDRVTAVNPTEYGARIKASIPTLKTPQGGAWHTARPTLKGTPAQNVRKTDGVIKELGEDASEKLTKRHASATAKVQEDVDIVNTIAQRHGLKEFGLDEAMQLPFTNHLDEMLYGERILNTFQSGAYRLFHVVDPADSLKIEFASVAVVYGFQNHTYEMGKGAEKVNTGETGFAGGIKEGGQGRNFIIDKYKNQPLRKTFGDVSEGDKQTPAEKEDHLLDNNKLNNKEIDPTKPVFNEKSAGNTDGTEQAQPPPDNSRLNTIIFNNFPTQ